MCNWASYGCWQHAKGARVFLFDAARTVNHHIVPGTDPKNLPLSSGNRLLLATHVMKLNCKVKPSKSSPVAESRFHFGACVIKIYDLRQNSGCSH